MRPSADRQGGFTLLELIVVTLIFGLAMTAVYSVLTTNTRSYVSQENIVQMNQELRSGMDLIVREIRMAGCNPTGASGIGFQDDSHQSERGTDADSIYFTMDINGDGNTNDPSGSPGEDPNEDINYFLYTSKGIQKLGRRTVGAHSVVQPVAEYVTELSFAYFDSSGAELIPPLSSVDLENIYAVKVRIAAETPKLDPILGDRRTESLTTTVRVRNAGLQ